MIDSSCENALAEVFQGQLYFVQCHCRFLSSIRSPSRSVVQRGDLLCFASPAKRNTFENGLLESLPLLGTTKTALSCMCISSFG